jgi:DNA-binding CsgD family transcriptional regulator
VSDSSASRSEGAASLTEAGAEALQRGRWSEARVAFEASIADGETAQARLGLATALWWLGDNRASVKHCTTAYSLFRRSGDIDGAVESALWLAITYKANFANFAAANGWIARAERLLGPVQSGPAHAWLWVTKAYRMADLDGAEVLTQRALDLARDIGDVDLELNAASQLGLIRVSKGDVAGGFALLDESMAAALGGEPSNLNTVVYTCCDMLNACELTNDAKRAAQWCQVADEFVESYGCPFLYAECRIYYGSVLTATGRWVDAERELGAGVLITAGACPGLHRRALTRLANLRIRQGRLEEAEQLLDDVGGFADTESDVALSVAALRLARGDGAGASRLLEHRWRTMERHRAHLTAALDLLVDARLSVGDVDEAAAAAARLAAVAAHGDDHLAAVALAARGRVAVAMGDVETAIALLDDAVGRFSLIEVPFETARTHFEIGRLLAWSQPDLAIDHARRALAGFAQLGAARDADRVAALLRSMGVASAAGRRGAGVLTAREQEVLELLGHGLSNPEIAARLYVSRKTAAHHVSRILTKLNLRSRAAAAAFATLEGNQRAR